MLRSTKTKRSVKTAPFVTCSWVKIEAAEAAILARNALYRGSEPGLQQRMGSETVRPRHYSLHRISGCGRGEGAGPAGTGSLLHHFLSDLWQVTPLPIC